MDQGAEDRTVDRRNEREDEMGFSDPPLHDCYMNRNSVSMMSDGCV